MPKRKSKTSRKSSNSSTMVSDITNNQMLPLATSSPRASVNESTCAESLTPQEIAEKILALNKKYEEGIMKIYTEEYTKVNEKLQDILKRYKGKSTFTHSDLKDAKKQFSERSRTLIGNSKRKVTRSMYDVSLPAIPEADSESLGENDENENVRETDPLKPPGSSDSVESTEKVLGKRIRKCRIQSDKSEEDEESSVFKRPTGHGKRTLKNSKQINMSAYKTPKTKLRYNVASVTPGPNSNGPVNVLRRPNPGEMAISLTGSPLLIASNNLPFNVPQISIPLADGRVMTVLANEGLDPDISIGSDIEPETRDRLAILQELLQRKTRKH